MFLDKKQLDEVSFCDALNVSFKGVINFTAPINSKVQTVYHKVEIVATDAVSFGSVYRFSACLDILH